MEFEEILIIMFFCFIVLLAISSIGYELIAEYEVIEDGQVIDKCQDYYKGIYSNCLNNDRYIIDNQLEFRKVKKNGKFKN